MQRRLVFRSDWLFAGGLLSLLAGAAVYAVARPDSLFRFDWLALDAGSSPRLEAALGPLPSFLHLFGFALIAAAVLRPTTLAGRARLVGVATALAAAFELLQRGWGASSGGLVPGTFDPLDLATVVAAGAVAVVAIGWRRAGGVAVGGTSGAVHNRSWRGWGAVALVVVGVLSAVGSTGGGDSDDETSMTFELNLVSHATAGGRIDIYSPAFEPGAEHLGGCNLELDDVSCEVVASGEYDEIELIATAYDPNEFVEWPLGRCLNADGAEVERWSEPGCVTDREGFWWVLFDSTLADWEVRVRTSELTFETERGETFVNGRGGRALEPGRDVPEGADERFGESVVSLPGMSNQPLELEITAEPADDNRLAWLEVYWHDDPEIPICSGVQRLCEVTVDQGDALPESTEDGVVQTARLHVFALYAPPLTLEIEAEGSGTVQTPSEDHVCTFNDGFTSSCSPERPWVVAFPPSDDLEMTLVATTPDGAEPWITVSWRDGGAVLCEGNPCDFRIRSDETPEFDDVYGDLTFTVGEGMDNSGFADTTWPSWDDEVLEVFVQFEGLDPVVPWVGTDGSPTPGPTVTPAPSTPSATPTPPPSPVGSWTLTVDPGPAGVCGDGDPYTETITLGVVDGEVRVTGILGQIEAVWSGAAAGGRLEFSGTKAETDGGTTDVTFTLTYDPASDTMSGTEAFDWRDGDLSCSGTSTVAATR